MPAAAASRRADPLSTRAVRAPLAASHIECEMAAWLALSYARPPYRQIEWPNGIAFLVETAGCAAAGRCWGPGAALRTAKKLRTLLGAGWGSS